MKVMSFNHMPLVRIDAPEWYEREDWMEWLNNRTPMNHPATWHVEGEKPNEYSDVFFTYCVDEGGSDYGEGKPSIPDDIWHQIEALIKAQDIDECLVWVSNLGIVG
jgi:hypothetical protein